MTYLTSDTFFPLNVAISQITTEVVAEVTLSNYL
jgi:hypothetical protein